MGNIQAILDAMLWRLANGQFLWTPLGCLTLSGFGILMQLLVERYEARRAKAVETCTEFATARAFKIDEKQERDADGDRHTYFRVWYCFTLPDGTFQESPDSIWRHPAAHRIGELVHIKYDPDNPSLVATDEHLDKKAAHLMRVMCWIFVLCGILFTLFMLASVNGHLPY